MPEGNGEKLSYREAEPEGGFIVIGQIHFVGQIHFSRSFPMTVKPVFRVGHFGGQMHFSSKSVMAFTNEK